MLEIWAIREDILALVFQAEVSDLRSGRELVNRLDYEEDRWPEGHDALAFDRASGECWWLEGDDVWMDRATALDVGGYWMPDPDRFVRP